MAFRKQGCKEVPASARGVFLDALRSGLSQAAAATVAGVSHATGNTWASAAGVAANSKQRGVRYPVPVREAFWAAMHSGASTAQAAVIAGVSEIAAQVWVQQAGYVPRTKAPADQGIDAAPRVRAPVTFVERCRLEELLENGSSPPQAAVLLGRHRDTIGRELRRGHTRSGYRARVAQDAAEASLKRPKPRKLDTTPALLDQVLGGLKQ